MVFTQPGSTLWGNAALQQLQHRGPDDHGWLAYGDSAERGRQPLTGSSRLLLLHRRLSILDLSEAGWQPMHSPDGRYHVAFNGEIYNYLELRQELKSHGHCFRSDSDTEVLLAAWAQWGTDCLNRLVGMFAFALLDTRRQTLHLVRDFFGIKPLYYCTARGGIGFASEIGPLLELPGVSRRVNPQRLYSYLRFALTDHGAQTMFADIGQVPAAHYLELNLSDPTLPAPTRYWSPELTEPSSLSFEQAAEQVRESFLESVRLHLRSDVPVGAALSGGIDSSAIVMAMRQLEPDLELHTFSYVADDPSLSEEHWVDIVGKAAKARVHKVRPGPQELVADLDRLVRIQGEPFGTTSIYAQQRVFGLAKEAGIKVMLDGQGADELLGGYPHYSAARLASLVLQGRLGEAVRLERKLRQLPGRSDSWKLALGHLLPTSLEPFARRVVGKELLPQWLNPAWFEMQRLPTKRLNHGNRNVLREELRLTLSETSLPMLLRYEDRNSMAHSIESRVPFLTPEFVNLVLNLPESYIISPDGTTKSVFRAAMRGIVPDVILDRKDKIGFQTPERRWLEVLAPWIEQRLRGEAVQQIPALRPEGLRQEWQDVRSGRRAFTPRVWGWINLIAWAEAFAVEWN